MKVKLLRLMIIKLIYIIIACGLINSCAKKQNAKIDSSQPNISVSANSIACDSIMEITDSLLERFYKIKNAVNEIAEKKQYIAAYIINCRDLDTVSLAYLSISKFYIISIDSAYKRFTLEGRESIDIKSQSVYSIFTLNDTFVQNNLGVGGMVIVMFTNRSKFISVWQCDKFMIRQSGELKIFKEIRDKVSIQHFVYNNKFDFFIPVSAGE